MSVGCVALSAELGLLLARLPLALLPLPPGPQGWGCQCRRGAAVSTALALRAAPGAGTAPVAAVGVAAQQPGGAVGEWEEKKARWWCWGEAAGAASVRAAEAGGAQYCALAWYTQQDSALSAGLLQPSGTVWGLALQKVLGARLALGVENVPSL